MATLTAPSKPMPIAPRSASAPERVYRITRDEYRRMEESGVFINPERIELIDGFLVERAVKSPRHELVSGTLMDTLLPLLPAGWHLRLGSSVEVSETDEPEPDGSVVRGKRTDYRNRHPNGSETGIAIEVAKSTLQTDRGVKCKKYAAAGIREFWIINLMSDQVEVHSEPDLFLMPPGYAQQTVYKPGDAVPLVLDGVTVNSIPVNDLLP